MEKYLEMIVWLMAVHAVINLLGWVHVWKRDRMSVEEHNYNLTMRATRDQQSATHARRASMEMGRITAMDWFDMEKAKLAAGVLEGKVEEFNAWIVKPENREGLDDH